MSSPLTLKERAFGSPLQLVSLAVAVACSIYVFLQLQPSLIFSDSTPAGGDMGAHVWGPAFMRDHLLPNLRLTGWTPDWYAGFPAYHFYMVVPSLLIILVNAGLPTALGIVCGATVLGLGLLVAIRAKRFRLLILVAALLLAIGLVPVPYGIAFKLVSVLGVVAIPLTAWAMAKLAGSIEPVPALVALAATVFLFDTNFTIYGGNILSTLAGEFAFSISLAFALLAIGLVARGMETDSHRAVAAIVLAMVALNHVIPLIFCVVAVVILIFLDNNTPRLWILGFAVTMFVAVWLSAWEFSGLLLSGGLSCLIVAGAIFAAEPTVRSRALWLLVVGPVSALLSFIWLVPFYAQSKYFNDMGWERLQDTVPALLTTPMKIAIPVAVIGAVFSVAMRDRIGMLFSLMAMLSAAGVLNLPHGRLWNARLLPFFYLSVYVVAALGIAYVVRFVGVALSEKFESPHQGWMAAATGIALIATLIGISIPLRTMPLGSVNVDGSYSWMGLTNQKGSPIPGWSSWNYSGYEEKTSYREYSDVITVMGEIGADNGCGRAMWEYNSELDRYGTPMALMLLPFWTDGCIGSMEGLYFESSSSTPFHFLNQSVLSEEPSRAQRSLPYEGFDIELGVSQLQTTGVRYYMAQTDTAIAAARGSDQLTELETVEPWVIFEVTKSQLVVGLDTEPIIAAGLEETDPQVEDRFDAGWLSEAVKFYNNADTYKALPAESGPAEWAAVTELSEDDGAPIDPAAVSDIRVGTDSISFSVDEIGKPVLVKISYFPNWNADGADGPWRAGPNLMVVVPTETNVKLSYDRSLWDWLGMLATLLGIAALVAMARSDRRRQLAPALAAAPLDPEELDRAELDDALPLDDAWSEPTEAEAEMLWDDLTSPPDTPAASTPAVEPSPGEPAIGETTVDEPAVDGDALGDDIEMSDAAIESLLGEPPEPDTPEPDRP